MIHLHIHFGSKTLLKCSAEQVGVKSAKVGILARQTAKGESTESRLSPDSLDSGFETSKLLKLALPGGGSKLC